MDVNGDGTLSYEELADGYKMHLGNILNKQELDELFMKADKDNSGSIDWKEFCIIAADRSALTSKDSLKQAFNLFDKDKSGSIDANELSAVLQTFNAQIPEKGSEAEA